MVSVKFKIMRFPNGAIKQMLNIWDVVLSTVIGNDEDRIWIIYPVDF